MKRPQIERLTTLMEQLRGANGCPWDAEQTLNTLVPFIIEEAYEVVSAIDSGEAEHIKEETGDLLFQIIFISRIMEEAGKFDLADVIEGSVEKMTRRHPHVFGDDKAETSDEVLKKWAEIKRGEKAVGAESGDGYLSGVPEALPALLRAHKIGKKAANVGFDWKDLREVLLKLDEEVDEFKRALSAMDATGIEEEIGDMLFTMVNVARFVEVNPEDALRKTVGKFINRFHYIEKKVLESGEELSSTPVEEMERLWQESKTRLK